MTTQTARRLPRTVRAKLDQATRAAEFERCALDEARIAQEILYARPRTSSRVEVSDEERAAAEAAARTIVRDFHTYIDTWVAHRLRTIRRWDDGEVDTRTLSYDI
jgi:hypothetical protein